jgi:hypothetical protein
MLDSVHGMKGCEEQSHRPAITANAHGFAKGATLGHHPLLRIPEIDFDAQKIASESRKMQGILHHGTGPVLEVGHLHRYHAKVFTESACAAGYPA